MEHEELTHEQEEQAIDVQQPELEPAENEPKQESAAEIQARNFKQLRETAEQLKRERDEAMRQLQERAKKSSSDDEDFSVAPDDLVEGKHLSKFQKKIQKLEEQIRQYQTSSSELAAETRLKATYPDFEKVVNQETITSLRSQYPELAATINASGDIYNKAVAAYTLIKKLNIMPDDETLLDQQLARSNKQKPRSLAAVSQADSPISHANAFANGLTDELRKQLWKEMDEARKNR